MSQLAQPLDDRLRVIADAGRDFLRVDAPVGAEQYDVRERPADVHADPESEER